MAKFELSPMCAEARARVSRAGAATPSSGAACDRRPSPRGCAAPARGAARPHPRRPCARPPPSPS
eukprot:scaffold32869_cov49-Phaeocystis_antarctica.AAC.3